MARSSWYFIFFVSCSTNLFSGLLPDSLVYLGHNRCCSVKNLELGDIVVSSKSCQAQNVSSNIAGIKLNKNATNNVILLTLESQEEILSSIMIGSDQRFCVQINSEDANCLPSLMWVEAEFLEQDMMLLGYNNEIFRIRDVQNINLERSTDLYEISLNPTNTFYLADSNGNLILTHNITWLVGFIIALGCGAVVGGGVGAGIAIQKAYAKNVKISKSTVAKGFLIGAGIGAIAATITYGGIYIGINYLPALISKLSIFLGCTEKTALLAESAAASKLSNVIFVGTVIKNVGCPAATYSCSCIDQAIEDFVIETERCEGEKINFSGININKASNKEFLGQTYVEMPINPKIFYKKKVFDKGNPIDLVFAA